ncbi:MAG: N-acetylmuramidase family protein [Candidatus Gracilibacteria bacterium]|nr:N-acetylmuramidase family protein [Candidatus Gracilibacteria bacterium]
MSLSAGPVAESSEKILPLDKNDFINKATEEHTALGEEVLGSMSYEEFFLKSPETKLKSLTVGKIGFHDIEEDQDITFDFSFEGEINRELYLKTTAAQVLPDTVGSIISEEKEYSRSSLKGEFFAQDGSRLVIHDKTEIIISQIRQVEGLKQNLTSQSIYGETTSQKNIAQKSLDSGFDPEQTLILFSSLFSGVSNLLDQSNFITDMDRYIGIYNQGKNGENIIDKENMTEADYAKIAYLFQQPKTESKSIEVAKKDFPGLDSLAHRLNIDPDVLHALWSNESSCSFDRHIQNNEPSYGFFQIHEMNCEMLGFNSKEEMRALLEHSNLEIRKQNNINALEIFINKRGGLLTALRNKDYHNIARLYNGKNYKTYAENNNVTAYDVKLRSFVENNAMA